MLRTRAVRPETTSKAPISDYETSCFTFMKSKSAKALSRAIASWNVLDDETDYSTLKSTLQDVTLANQRCFDSGCTSGIRYRLHGGAAINASLALAIDYLKTKEPTPIPTALSTHCSDSSFEILMAKKPVLHPNSLDECLKLLGIQSTVPIDFSDEFMNLARVRYHEVSKALAYEQCTLQSLEGLINELDRAILFIEETHDRLLFNCPEDPDTRKDIHSFRSLKSPTERINRALKLLNIVRPNFNDPEEFYGIKQKFHSQAIDLLRKEPHDELTYLNVYFAYHYIKGVFIDELVKSS